jgi:hypothetical protein
MSFRRSEFDVTNRINTTDPVCVKLEVSRIFRTMYARTQMPALAQAFDDMVRLYRGEFPGYLGCDTQYHDIQHVLDVTLAMVRLMHGYESSREHGNEAIGPSLFVAGALGALFHDFGYLRRHNDHRHRYGAEYTITHVSRSAAFVRGYMRKLGFSDDLARLAATLQHFTGYERKAHAIRIGRGLPRLVGQMLGSADIIAQMSDRCYLEKCRDRLYPEFVLGALGAPKKAPRLPTFASGDELVAKTPAFYEGATRRLNDELGHAYDYAARYFDGENPYLDGMRKNVSHAAQPAPVLRRRPPSTLLPDVEPYPRDLVGLSH